MSYEGSHQSVKHSKRIERNNFVAYFPNRQLNIMAGIWTSDAHIKLDNLGRPIEDVELELGAYVLIVEPMKSPASIKRGADLRERVQVKPGDWRYKTNWYNETKA
jgi:hypothetical protein